MLTSKDKHIITVPIRNQGNKNDNLKVTQKVLKI